MSPNIVRFFDRKLFDIVIDMIIFLFCLLIFLSVAYPLYFVVIASVSDPTAIYNGEVIFLPKGVNLFGYQKIMSDSRIWNGYKNTLIYTFLGTSINLLLTLPAAYALSVKKFKAQRPIMLLFVFTMFFNGGLIPTYMLIKNLNLINKIWAMVIPFSVSVFNLIITRTYIQKSIPEELYEAAALDGCSHFRYFSCVVLPLSKSIISVIGLYYFVGHWNSWFNALMYLNKEDMQPLQMVLRSILLANQLTQDGGMGVGDGSVGFVLKSADLIKYGIIIVSSLPLILIYTFLQKHFEKGVMIGSLKG